MQGAIRHAAEMIPPLNPHALIAFSRDPNTAVKVPWESIRNSGVAFWLGSHAALTDLCKKVANVKFDIKAGGGDPLDAALFYLAMGKKTLLVALLKKVANIKMANFFAQVSPKKTNRSGPATSACRQTHREARCPADPECIGCNPVPGLFGREAPESCRRQRL